MDRFFPDDILLHIVSFLPNQFAARTALVSRRMRRLWKASPFLNLDITYSSRLTFTAALNSALLHCKPPLRRLRLRLRLRLPYWNCDKPTGMSAIFSLLDKACALGLRHLSVQINPSHIGLWTLILPRILSLGSLESLSLENVVFPNLPPGTPINLKNVRSLCINLCRGLSIDESPTDFINWLVPQLDALEYLHIRSSAHLGFLHIKSDTVRKLKLDVHAYQLRISAPSLEHFELESNLGSSFIELELDWDWAMPMLKKAVIQLKGIHEKNVKAIFNMLYAVANVQELHINITESWNQIDTFHALLLPGVDPPTFFDLKHFKLEICFHEYNVEDLVTLIQHSPVLESLTLVHKPLFSKDKKKKKLWSSYLPKNIDGIKEEVQLLQNTEGYDQHAYVEDLRIPGRKKELQLLQNIKGNYQQGYFGSLYIPGDKEDQQLLQNTEGSCQHVYFEDLHILGRKEELLRHLISWKRSSKRLKT